MRVGLHGEGDRPQLAFRPQSGYPGRLRYHGHVVGAQYEYIIYVNKRDYDAARDAAGLPGDIR